MASATNLPTLAPAVTTLPPNSITSNTATLLGEVIPNGAASSAWFQYGTTTNYGSNTPTTFVSQTNSLFVSNSISGLSEGVTYHCQLVASNSAGTSTGGDVTFGTLYFGNSLTVSNGAPDGVAKSLVILGEYSPSGPLATSTVTLPTGTVQDLKFYGQNYNFTLYALSYVSSGPNTNEQTFQVVASQSFSGSPTNVGIQTLAVTNFSVYAGDLLAFAGTGPYYPQNANDATNSDATYYDVSGYMPPGGPGSQFTVGTNGDSSATYEYISNASMNQGRTYGIGVDVATP
jgi:hypothetical protein